MKHARSRPRFRVGLFAALTTLLLSLGGVVPSLAETGPDYALAGGHFYTQTGGGNEQGYSVLDAGIDRNGQPIKFWTAFQRLGGVATLGYPVSQPYVGADGFTYQAFQAGILQWRPELGDAVLTNTFDILESSGLGSWLTEAKGLPQPITDDGSGGDFQKAMATRLEWLTDPAIEERVLANPNPQVIDEWNAGLALQLFGLPKSRPEQHGPFVSQLFQRVSVQRWTTEVPGMPPVGSVVVVLGGDLMKEAGLIPASATQVLGPGGVALVSPAPSPAPVAPVAAPAAPDYPWALSQVGAYPNCGTTYFSVRALDTNGNGVNGLTIRSWNDYGNVHEEGTRNYQDGDGYADRIAGAGKWYVALYDGDGRQSSNIATVNFTATCDPAEGAVNQVALELRQGGWTPAAPQPAVPVAAPAPDLGSYPWRLTQTAAWPNCGTTYVRVLARDINGNAVNGMTVKSWNDYGNEYVASTGHHNGVDGYWDRVFGSGAVEGKWYVMLIDGQGRQSSNIATVNFTGNCDPSTGAVQEVELVLQQLN